MATAQIYRVASASLDASRAAARSQAPTAFSHLGGVTMPAQFNAHSGATGPTFTLRLKTVALVNTNNYRASYNYKSITTLKIIQIKPQLEFII